MGSEANQESSLPASRSIMGASSGSLCPMVFKEEPPSSAAASGSADTQHPVTSTWGAWPGWERLARRIACRDFAAACDVTAQVCTTSRSAGMAFPAGFRPLESRSDSISRDSAWFTRQPRVRMRKVGLGPCWFMDGVYPC